ncbi:hypothetical protein [Prescottella agglutinans]|uniref:Uncharacterized protein n=1 Tax=Prescottella agglutinans TaxID=1644129 RepID=A0ABT6MM85_9NOCA|nr:hypothetical protein [Prescottella agglutinans]MDH6284619.1 hypothetical protein [Prescottella agglutinans]
MAMQQNRPNRFGASPAAPSPATLAAAQAAPQAAAPESPALAPVPAPEPEPAPKEAPATPKKAAATKKPARTLKTNDVDVLRKSVEWTASVEELFQDGCDDWYGDRNKRERKRRLGRRPSDNKMVTAMVLLALEAIADNDKYNDRLEELLPSDARRRNAESS